MTRPKYNPRPLLFDPRCQKLEPDALRIAREQAQFVFEDGELTRQAVDAGIITYLEHETGALVHREIEAEGERKPCPHCRAQNVFLTHSVRNLDARRHVECRICGMHGPVMTSNDLALDAWNNLPR